MNDLPCNPSWSAIRKPRFFEQPEVQRDLLPVWSFSALYDQPDGEVARPSSYMADNGVVAWRIRTYAHREPTQKFTTNLITPAMPCRLPPLSRAGVTLGLRRTRRNSGFPP